MAFNAQELQQQIAQVKAQLQAAVAEQQRRLTLQLPIESSMSTAAYIPAQSAVSSLSSAYQQIVQPVVQKVEGVGAEVINAAFNTIIKPNLDALSRGVNDVIAGFNYLSGKLDNFFSPYIQKVEDGFSNLWGKTKSLLFNQSQNLNEGFKIVTEGVSGELSSLYKNLSHNFDNLADFFSHEYENIVEDLKNGYAVVSLGVQLGLREVAHIVEPILQDVENAILSLPPNFNKIAKMLSEKITQATLLQHLNTKTEPVPLHLFFQTIGDWLDNL